MNKTADTTTDSVTPEPCNVAVDILENRTKVRNAICAAGACEFPLTKTEADSLVALGKARITGIFAIKG